MMINPLKTFRKAVLEFEGERLSFDRVVMIHDAAPGLTHTTLIYRFCNVM
jgi:hypothetical protein